MITGLDHCPVIVADLDAEVAAFTALLGRSPTFTARLPGARHAWFQLPGFALDVIAPDGEGPAGDEARARLAKHGPGPYAIGWTVDDPDAAARLFERRGLASAGAGDTVSHGDDGAEHAWRIAMLRARPTGGLPMFLARAAAPITESPPLADPAAAVAGLDHLVVNTEDPDRALALYGARLGLDLRLDRTEERWNTRFLFFKAGTATVEVVTPLHAEPTGAPDRIGGLAWRVGHTDAARARIAAAGLDASEVRPGRKPGTRVFTVRDAPAAIPTLMIGAA